MYDNVFYDCAGGASREVNRDEEWLSSITAGSVVRRSSHVVVFSFKFF